MPVVEQYHRKPRSQHDAIDVVRNNDVIVVSTGAGELPGLLQVLFDRRCEFRGVCVAQMFPMWKFDYFDAETVDHVCHLGAFLGTCTPPRQRAQRGWIDALACNFSDLSRYLREGLTPVEVFSLASPMDEHRYFALGLSADYSMAAIERARALVLEVNPNVPFSFAQCHVHVAQVTALVERDESIVEARGPKVGPVREAIGRHVEELVENGSTLQTGYGGIPDAVVTQLKAKRDLGIHTGLIRGGLLSLIECGAVTNARKNYLPGMSIADRGWVGSARLYRFMHRNPAFELHPADFVNDQWIASRNDNLVTINATLQIDLAGQCVSEALGPLPYSWQRRAGRFRALREPLEWRQVGRCAPLHGEGGCRLADRADSRPRESRDDRQKRYQLCRHGVRCGPVCAGNR